MSPGSPSSWRLGWQTWLGLLNLGLARWLITTYFGLITEMIRLVFGAFLISMAIRPLAHWRILPGITVLGVYVALVGFFVLMGAPRADYLCQDKRDHRRSVHGAGCPGCDRAAAGHRDNVH